MNRNKIYALIAIILLLGVYGYNFWLDKEEELKVINEGIKIKGDTNVFFLPSSTTGQVVHHEGYSLSYYEKYEQAEWVAYELKKDHLANTNFKRPYFEIDKTIKTKAAHWRNYKQSGYDRGHLCPAGDRKYSKQTHDETFLTSNISPQLHVFNSGVWNTLEQKVRYWAKKYNGIYVVTGGVLNGELPTIGEERVGVPNYFYKVLLDYNNGKPKAIAFLLEHEKSNRSLSSFVVPVDTIEHLTGIDFFPNLEDEIEEQIESSIDFKGWNF